MSGVKNFLRMGAILFASLLVMTASAQTLDEAKRLYNEGGEAVQAGDLELGLQKFVECIEMCEILVDDYEDMEAEELMFTVQQNVPKLHYQLGMDQIKSGQVGEGLDNLYQAKEKAEWYGDDETLEKANKVIPQVHYKLAASKYKNSDLDGALVELEKAIAVDADYENAYYLEAVIYKTREEDDKLAEAATKAIAAAEKNNDAKTKGNTVKLASGYFLKKGNDAKESSSYDEAILNLKRSLEFDDDNATAYFLLTSVYNAQKDWDNAISTAKKGIEHESAADQPRFYYELGNAYFGKGDNASACEAYSKAAVGDYAEHANYQMEHVVKCN